jgi:long-chain acyl-CoA synthetase
VIGIPDDVLGNAICAFVSLKSGGSLVKQDLLSFCADRLEDFMVPKKLYFREQLPKSANGKIARRLLAAEMAGEAALAGVLP